MSTVSERLAKAAALALEAWELASADMDEQLHTDLSDVERRIRRAADAADEAGR